MSKYIVLIVLFVFVVFSPLRTLGQDYHKTTRTVLVVKDSILISIIDSLINFEKRCDYFNNSLRFSIFLNMDSTIQISSISDRTIEVLGLGCFTYRGHLFLVGGKILNANLFSITNRRKTITYYKPPKEEIQPEDDSYTEWIYKYSHGKFIFISHHTFCK